MLKAVGKSLRRSKTVTDSQHISSKIFMIQTGFIDRDLILSPPEQKKVFLTLWSNKCSVLHGTRCVAVLIIYSELFWHSCRRWAHILLLCHPGFPKPRVPLYNNSLCKCPLALFLSLFGNWGLGTLSENDNILYC